MATESGSYTPDVIARRLEMAKALLADPKRPVRHWAEGLNELFKGAHGGYLMGQAEREQREGETAQNEARLTLMGMGGAVPAVAGALNAPAGASAAPTPMAPPQPPGDVPGRIIGAESGGDPAAVNPNSSAAGPGQFIDSTWLETIKKNRPDLASGKDDATLLALRTDPAQAGLSREMTAAYAKQNAGTLADAGHPATPGNTYLAHFVGPGGATRVLGADPATPVRSLLAPEAIAANPMLRGMTAGDLRAWADKKMGGPVVAGPGGVPAKPDAAGVFGPDATMVPPPEPPPPVNQVAGPGAPSGGNAVPPIPAGPAVPPSAAVPAVAAALGAPTPAAAGPSPAASARPDASDARTKIAAMLRSDNPYVRKQGGTIADAIATKQMADTFAAPKFDFKTAGDTLYRTEERTGVATPVKDTGRAVRPMTAAERTQWNVPEGLSAGLDANGKPVFSPPGVNVNVGGGSDKQIFDVMDESAKTARTTAAGLVGLREAREAIKGGAITGAGANQMLGLQKVASLFGAGNTDKIVNTETFRAAIAPQVASVLKSTVGTANISNTDREFAEKAAGGNITLDEKSISRLLDIMERASTKQLAEHQKRLDKVYPPDVEKHRRERALFGVDAPEAPAVAPPAAAPPPAAPAGAAIAAPIDPAAIEAEMKRRKLM